METRARNFWQRLGAKNGSDVLGLPLLVSLQQFGRFPARLVSLRPNLTSKAYLRGVVSIWRFPPRLARTRLVISVSSSRPQELRGRSVPPMAISSRRRIRSKLPRQIESERGPHRSFLADYHQPLSITVIPYLNAKCSKVANERRHERCLVLAGVTNKYVHSKSILRVCQFGPEESIKTCSNWHQMDV